MEPAEKKQLEEMVIQALKSVYDPEIPVDIYELGLIYEIRIDNDRKALIVMTLTSPSCPVAESLPAEVEQKVANVDGIEEATVEITWDPPWDKDMMSEEALVELGMI